MAEPRGVQQQVLDGDGARRPRAAWPPGASTTFTSPNSGRYFDTGIVEPELALLVQHHHRDGGDRLGHRVDAEERPRRHRRAGLQVLHADGFEVRRPSRCARPRRRRRQSCCSATYWWSSAVASARVAGARPRDSGAAICSGCGWPRPETLMAVATATIAIAEARIGRRIAGRILRRTQIAWPPVRQQRPQTTLFASRPGYTATACRRSWHRPIRLLVVRPPLER